MVNYSNLPRFIAAKHSIESSMAVATVHCAKQIGALAAFAAVSFWIWILLNQAEAPLPPFLSQKFSGARVSPTLLPKSVPTEPSQNDQFVLTQHPACNITAFKVYTGTLEEKRAWFLSRLADYSQPFSFVRFGDGEWMCALGTAGSWEANIDGQTFNKNMCKQLKQFLLDVEGRKSVHMFLQGHECQFTRQLNALDQGIGQWYQFRGFLDLLTSGLLAKAMALVRGRGHVVLVGPRPLSKLKIAFGYSAYIEVPQKGTCGSNAGSESFVYSLVDQILAESKREPSNVTFLVAGGMAMKVVVLTAAKHLHHKDSFLDIGSTFTHFAAEQNRRFRNQGAELTLDHYETHPDADYRSMRAWFNTTAGDGCLQVGTFSSKYEKRAELCGVGGQSPRDNPVQSVWREYMLFHNSCRFRTDCAILVWKCANADTCGGIADQQKGLVSALLIAIITKRMLLVDWTQFGVDIQSTLFAPGMIDTRASLLYADRCKTIHSEAPLDGLDLRTTQEADRLVDNVNKSKKLCLRLQTNLNPELLLAAGKGLSFYELPYLRGCAHRFMFKPLNRVWFNKSAKSGPQIGIHLRLVDQVRFAKAFLLGQNGVPMKG